MLQGKLPQEICKGDIDDNGNDLDLLSGMAHWNFKGGAGEGEVFCRF
jgi:hypothetical protein